LKVLPIAIPTIVLVDVESASPGLAWALLKPVSILALERALANVTGPRWMLTAQSNGHVVHSA